MADVAFVLHGHFYQPPRENPWTEVVPRQPAAAPFHDWNERITAECYRPNGWARILDDHGRIVAIVDNYEHLSFNVGPTLMSWLDEHAPETYARIVEADRSGRRAIAQGYGHAILPLCNDRDLRTQVRWGLADFRHRFGRPAEGLWLPETAVDDRTLAVLAEEGVRFTILAPGQIAAVRDARRRLAADRGTSGRRAARHGAVAAPRRPRHGRRPGDLRRPDQPRRGVRGLPQPGRGRAASWGGPPASSCRWPVTARRSATTTTTPIAVSPTPSRSRPTAAASPCPGWPTGWSSTRRSTRRRSTCPPGRVRTGSGAGSRTAGATPAASRAGTRRGGAPCGRRSTGCATPRSRCSSGGARPCCTIRGRPATPTSTCSSAWPRSSGSRPTTCAATASTWSTPSPCSRASATRC